MKNLLSISLILFVLFSCGCQQSQGTKPRQAPQAADTRTAQTFMWHRDLGRIAVAPSLTATAQVEKSAATRMEVGPEPIAMPEDSSNTFSMIYPSADYQVIQIDKIMPKQVQINTPFSYYIKVTNLTDRVLNDVVITEELSKNFSLTNAYPTANKDAEKLVWTIETLGPKSSKRFDISGSATSTDGLKHRTTVTQPNQAFTNVEVVQPKLELSVNAPAEVLLCESIPVEFIVTNVGTGIARNVKVVYVLPSGLETVNGTSEIVFDAGDVPSHGSRQFTTQVRAVSPGVYVNKALAGSVSGLRSESAAVLTTVRQPRLTLTNSGPKQQYLGRPLRYDITLSNTGNGPANNTVLEYAIPAGVTSVEATGGAKVIGSKVVWEFNSIAPDSFKQMRVSYTPTESGSLMNTATARAYCADNVTAVVETFISGIPALRLAVVDVEDPIEVAGETTYVITATNEGTATDTNIRITCILEDSFRYVSSTGATTGSLGGNTINFAPLGSLAPKAQATWRVIVTGVRAGDARFKVTMSSDHLTRPVEQTEATLIYQGYGSK